MSVSSIPSISSLSGNSLQSRFQEKVSNLKQLSQALKSGDLSGAQKAYSALTQGSGLGTSNSSSSQNGPLAQDLQAVGKALQSGDLAGAQTAFAQFQKDVSSAAQSQPTVGGAHHGHHRHHVSSSSAPSSAPDSSSSTSGSTSTPATVTSATGSILNLFA